MLVDRYVPLTANDQQSPGRGDGMFADHFDLANNQFRGGSLRQENFCHFRRPFKDDRGHPCVLFNSGRFWTIEKGERKYIPRPYRIADLLNKGIQVPLWTWNVTSLRPKDWEYIDDRMVMAVRPPLVAWEDLAGRNRVSGFNAYAHATYKYEAMSDAHEAVVDMDMLTPGRNDQPLLINRELPLPITHSDFWYSDRFLEISSNSGQPMSNYSIDMAGRRIGEMVEDTLLGEITGVTYSGSPSGNYLSPDGASTVWGYQNFTFRNIKNNITTPTGSNPQATVTDVLDMIQTLKGLDYFGPYVSLWSLAWDRYLDADYAFTNGSNWAVAPTQTLRQRLEQIDGLEQILTVPRLGSANEFIIILMDVRAEVAEAIEGQSITTLQWETVGGLKKNFKVWCIMVPFLKAEYNDNSGIIVGTTS